MPTGWSCGVHQSESSYHYLNMPTGWSCGVHQLENKSPPPKNMLSGDELWWLLKEEGGCILRFHSKLHPSLTACTNIRALIAVPVQWLTSVWCSLVPACANIRALVAVPMQWLSSVGCSLSACTCTYKWCLQLLVPPLSQYCPSPWMFSCLTGQCTCGTVGNIVGVSWASTVEEFCLAS